MSERDRGKADDRDYEGVSVREATPDDRLGVRRVLDAAMLDVREDLAERIAAGDVLVVRRCDSDGDASDAPILGALVLVPRGGAPPFAHVDAVAVRRARRGRGVGTALVRAAAERYPRLTAEFDREMRPFYESLGFEIAAADDGRLRGRYVAEADEYDR
ncbi:GNAT family N-acetyltransferase [Halobacteriales archaeon QS_1_67_19]|nr:MAG: GNAT family N-acetyltransferase [Halobacteriales archaeon QS_1_67_19]